MHLFHMVSVKMEHHSQHDKTLQSDFFKIKSHELGIRNEK
jgi:hypothetical protein